MSTPRNRILHGPALFVPLATKHFDRFWNGDKDTERRIYGGPWTEANCYEGRAVTLSLGYSGPRRIQTTISSFVALPLKKLPHDTQNELRACYPGKLKAETLIACISTGYMKRETFTPKRPQPKPKPKPDEAVESLRAKISRALKKRTGLELAAYEVPLLSKLVVAGTRPTR